VRAVSVLQTVLTFVVAPLGLYLLIGAATLARRSRRRKYKEGRPWPYPPVLWTADPEGADLPPLADAPADPRVGVLTDGGSKPSGGARGSW
jgi:hypothetical protein